MDKCRRYVDTEQLPDGATRHAPGDGTLHPSRADNVPNLASYEVVLNHNGLLFRQADTLRRGGLNLAAPVNLRLQEPNIR